VPDPPGPSVGNGRERAPARPWLSGRWLDGATPARARARKTISEAPPPPRLTDSGAHEYLQTRQALGKVLLE
jgi:hypothetical protein